MLKTSGYLVSTISVMLLGAVAWQSASEKPLMLACLLAGMITSVGGMLLRWLSFHKRQKQAKGAVAQLVVREPRTRADPRRTMPDLLGPVAARGSRSGS